MLPPWDTLGRIYGEGDCGRRYLTDLRSAGRGLPPLPVIPYRPEIRALAEDSGARSRLVL
jgi:hypothetical protein